MYVWTTLYKCTLYSRVSTNARTFDLHGVFFFYNEDWDEKNSQKVSGQKNDPRGPRTPKKVKNTPKMAVSQSIVGVEP